MQPACYIEKTRVHMSTSGSGFSRWAQWLTVSVILALLGAGGYLLWQRPAATPPAGKRGGDPARRVMPVVAVPAKSANINVYLNGLGTVTPLKTVIVRSRVDGQLMRVLFREGQVSRGTVGGNRSAPFRRVAIEGQMARDRRCSPTRMITNATACCSPRIQSPSNWSTQEALALTKASSSSIRASSTTPGCSLVTRA